MINCYEAVARLHLYIDRELNAEEIVTVQQHLSHCSSCECRFHFNVQLRRLIHKRCTIERAPTHLREAVLLIARSPLGEPVELDPEVEMELRADIAADEECE